MTHPLRSGLVLCLGLCAAPALAAGGSGLDLTLHYGLDEYDAVGLRSGLGGVGDSGRLRDASTHAGATAILRGGMAEIGEIGRPGKDGTTTLLGALLGAGFDTGPLRLELLGVWAFARWDLTTRDVRVSLASDGDSTYRLGGAQFGGSLRAGISL